MEFYSLVTNYGLNRQIAALSNKATIKLTKMAIGDSELPIDQNLSDIRGKKHQFSINSIEQDQENATMLIATGVVPSDVGGFYIREVGIYDDKDQLFAIAKIAPTYKPLLSEGSAKDLTIKFYLQVENVNNIELKIDPSVVIATRKWTLDNLNKKADKLDVYTKKETFNQDEINALIPAGTIIQSASKSTPNGYLKCNGASISRVSYQKLFEIIGTTFGSDDNNTFRLPDSRGRFIRGFSDGSSLDSGRAFGSSQDSAIGRHIHLLPTGVGSDKLGDGAIWGVPDGQWVNTKNTLNASPKDNSFAFTHNDDGGERAKNFLRKKGLNYFFENFKNETRPYNIALNFYIKY